MAIRDPFDPTWEPPPASAPIGAMTAAAEAKAEAAPPLPGAPATARSGDKLDSVAGGVKLLNGAVGLYLLLVVLNVVFTLMPPSSAGLALAYGGFALLAALAVLVLALVGLGKIQRGLGKSIGVRIITVLAMFIPLVGLVVMLIVNNGAVKALKAAGYRISSGGLKVEAPAAA